MRSKEDRYFFFFLKLNFKKLSEDKDDNLIRYAKVNEI